MKLCICKGKKNLDIDMKRKMIDNKYNLYQIYEFKIIAYDMKLKWIIFMLMIMCVMIKKKYLYIRNWGMVK